jgi:hypothetical protein
MTAVDDDHSAVERDIRRYLETGEVDSLFSGWPGEDMFDAARGATRTLKRALLAEVERRAAGRVPPALPPGLDPEGFARVKLAPIVDGLFPAEERQVVLGLIERSVLLLTPDTIERAIMDRDCWLSTARNLANIYLGSLGVAPLAGDYAHIVGLSEETRCSYLKRP